MDRHYLEILELPVEEEAVTAVGATVTHRNITYRIFRIRTLIDKVLFLFVCLLPELWLLGSWQFVLSKWYLPVLLPCPSLDVVQCRRSQTELSLRGIRGEKRRSFPRR